MCMGLTGLQLLFDAAVHHRQMGQDLPEDLQLPERAAGESEPCVEGAASTLQ